MTDVVDVAIVGGGAAGLSGAVALARARRTVLVIDAGEPRNAAAGHVHSYLGNEGKSPADLLALGRAEAAGYGAQLVAGRVAAAARLPRVDGAPWFQLTLADGAAVRARRLLLAMGVADDLPHVEGMAARWGREVMHCPYCHGWEIRDQAIGVLGTNGCVAPEALLFRQWSKDVVLFQHTAPALSDEQCEQLAARGIPVVEGHVRAVVLTDDNLSGVELVSGEVVARTVLAVMPRSTVAAPWLRELGLEPLDQTAGGRFGGTYLAADADGATETEGVWAAGNVTDLSSLVVSAAAAGSTAATAINVDLVGDDTRLAVITGRARRPTLL